MSSWDPKAPFHISKKNKKAINLKPKHILEGLFAQTLADLNYILDTFYASTETDASFTSLPRFKHLAIQQSPAHLVKMTYHNVLGALEEMVKNASMYSDASLNVRHRKTRTLIQKFIAHCIAEYELTINALAEDATSMQQILSDETIVSYFKDLCCFMLSFHHLMHADSSIKDRANIELEFDQALDASKTHLQHKAYADNVAFVSEGATLH